MELRVGDVMTRGVIYVHPTDNVQRAAEIMRKNDIDSVIIMKEGKGIGIATDRDVISKIVAEGKDPRSVTVSEIMTSPLITINPEADVDDAARNMRDRNIRRLVVTKNDRIIGIISEFDLIRVEPALHLLIMEHSKWDIADIPAPASQMTGICEECENYSENLRNVNGRLLCDECIQEERE